MSGVRFLLLGTDAGGLRATQFEQLVELKSMLEAARLDRAVRRVVVLGHHVPASFTDGREAALVARWLTEFEERSGKEAVYLATGGQGPGPVVRRVEGIPYLEAGGPKAPMLFTVDLNPGAPWIRLKTQ